MKLLDKYEDIKGLDRLYMTSKGHMVYDNKYKVYYELRDDMQINQEQKKEGN